MCSSHRVLLGMLKSLCRLAPRCSTAICQRVQLRSLSDEKRTGFGDIMIEYEPYKVTQNVILLLVVPSIGHGTSQLYFL